LIALINAKLANTKYAKYLTCAVDIITNAVKSTYQTYVEVLKDKDAFTADAQKEALNKAKEIALAQMTVEVKNYIANNFGDVEVWVSNTLESTIYDLKNKN
ncbi:MAG: hypothetical protein K2H24_00410, partial [Clostridia bacterium]|nr:hypothetical protein [Clostridia bacterium]